MYVIAQGTHDLHAVPARLGVGASPPHAGVADSRDQRAVAAQSELERGLARLLAVGVSHGVCATLTARLHRVFDLALVESLLGQPRSQLLPDPQERLRNGGEDTGEDAGVSGLAPETEEDEVVEAALGEFVDDLATSPVACGLGL